MVYVSCGGYIKPYKNIKEVIEFYKECTYYCEGSERERYMNIIVDALDHMGKQEVCLSDGMRVHGVDFNINDLTEKQLMTIRTGFKLTVEELANYAVKYAKRNEVK
jgi:hypothetical protein